MDPGTEAWKLARKSAALRSRAAMLRAFRQFFYERDYLEIETPVRIPAPAPEEHIEAPPSGDWYLRPRPSFA